MGLILAVSQFIEQLYVDLIYCMGISPVLRGRGTKRKRENKQIPIQRNTFEIRFIGFLFNSLNGYLSNN